MSSGRHAIPATADEPTRNQVAEAVRVAHVSPCPWSRAIMWVIGVISGIALVAGTGVWQDTADLRKDNIATAGDLREVQTDIRYIREALVRIEASVLRTAHPAIDP